MFDPPSNLPVEPTLAVPSSQPKPEKGVGVGSPSGKEPEDIFADMDTAGNDSASIVPKEMTHFDAPAKSPLKIVLAIIVPVGILALGIGGYYLYSSYNASNTAKTPVVPTSTQAQQTTIPATDETGDRVPLNNPMPEPDDSDVAASKAAMALLQNQKPLETEAPTTTDTESNVETSSSTDSQTETVTEGESYVPPAPVAAMPGTDSDGDGLTDAEESVLGTLTDSTDSDGDGYADGSETASGYDPATAKASLLASTGLKTEKVGMLNIYVPATWLRGVGAGGTVVLRSGTPATVTISLDAYASAQSLVDYLMAKYPGSIADDYIRGNNANGLDVVYSKDKLSSWIVYGNTLYSMRYATNGTAIDYPNLFEIMNKYAIKSN